MSYINDTGIDLYPGGVPNTLMQSGEQWDYPNVWPPMQYILVEGLKALDDEKASELAFDWASRWVRSNFIAFRDTRAMYEKVMNEKLFFPCVIVIRRSCNKNYKNQTFFSL